MDDASYPSTSIACVTFVMQVSTRHADMLEIALRSAKQPLSGAIVLLARDLRVEDPIFDSLGNWQHLVAMTCVHDTENIILRGPVDKLKEVLWYLVRDVWLSRRITRTMQIVVPLLGPNSLLASSVRQGVFSNIAEQSASVIALTPTPSGSDYSLATIEGDRESMSIALSSLIEVLRPPPSSPPSPTVMHCVPTTLLSSLDEPIRTLKFTADMQTVLPPSKRTRTMRADIRPLPRRAMPGASAAPAQRVTC